MRVPERKRLALGCGHIRYSERFPRKRDKQNLREQSTCTVHHPWIPPPTRPCHAWVVESSSSAKSSGERAAVASLKMSVLSTTLVDETSPAAASCPQHGVALSRGPRTHRLPPYSYSSPARQRPSARARRGSSSRRARARARPVSRHHDRYRIFKVKTLCKNGKETEQPAAART